MAFDGLSLLPPTNVTATLPLIFVLYDRVLGDVNPDWHPNVSNYATDFTKKPTVGQTGRSPLPIHDNRKNNPHPSHLAHLRRLSNEVSDSYPV